MTTRTKRRSHITATRPPQLARAQALLELLEAESDALQARRDDQVTELAEKKQRLLSALENDHHPCRPPATDETTWHQLQRCLEQCQRLNVANGRLVARRKAVIEHGLQILRGVNGDKPVYTADGHPARNQTARQLGSV